MSASPRSLRRSFPRKRESRAAHSAFAALGPRFRGDERVIVIARHQPHFALFSQQKRPRRSPMAMSVGVLDHYNVSTRKLKETIQFYEDVLGFENGPRPPFNFPGAWLYSAGHPVLHINDISNTDKRAAAGFRRDRSRRVRQPRLRGDQAAPHRQGRPAPRQSGTQLARAGRFSFATPTTWRSSSISKPRTSSPRELAGFTQISVRRRESGDPVPCREGGDCRPRFPLARE